MLKSAKERAIKNNLDFNITEDDIVITDRCPVFGFKYDSSDKKDMRSPSLDRIIPELGYTKGNVIVVSMKANTMKSNADIEEIKTLYEFYKNIIKKGTIK